MKRRGSTPQERGSATGQSCPDVIELDKGDFLIIGTRMFLEGFMVDDLREVGALVDPSTEAGVVIPRRVFLDAAKEVMGDQPE